MRIKTLTFYGLFFYLIMVSCQQSVLVKKEEPQALRPDSILYYQQKDIPDPLLDAVIGSGPDTLVLHTRLIPPPPPPEKFRRIEGLRVQVFAGLDSLNAAGIHYQLMNQQEDSVYFFKDKGLFKIQVGDYLYRPDADKKRQTLRNNGFSGAWVVQTMINVPSDSTQADSNSAVGPMDEKVFRIQVLATGDKDRAETLAEELQQSFDLPAVSRKVDDLYKVYLGKFITRQEAEEALKQVRTQGYTDAWIVKE
ncbi:MAG TPA: SPOR domain-containing protein [Calditrichaeota bacterium]|nr:SPOR domain-containing protein [Calditrichota bacterium]